MIFSAIDNISFFFLFWRRQHQILEDISFIKRQQYEWYEMNQMSY